MSPRTRRLPLALGLIASFSLGAERGASAAGSAAAQTGQSTHEADSDSIRKLAQAKYEQGVEAYRAEHYADAARLFLEADAISPSAALSYNIARAYEKLADDAQTLRWYRNYLRLNPEPQNASAVRGYIGALSSALAKKGIQQVSVLSTPPGATVAIDGNPLGVTPLTVELAPGAHTALVSLRGYSDAATHFTLPVTSAVDVSVSLRASPLPTAAQAPAAAHSDAGAHRFGVVPYVTLGVAAACLSAAGLFELSRRAAQDSAKKEQVQLTFEDDVHSIDSRRTAARVFLGVGSALAVTGGALLVLDTRVTPESRAAVASVPGGALFSWARSF